MRCTMSLKRPTCKSLQILLVGFAGFHPAKAPADEIVNGGFEQPAIATFLEVVAPNSATIPGWTVTAGSVDVVNAAGNGFDVGPADQGAQYLDLNGTRAGTISQTFPTTPGATYQLSFAYANNYFPPTSLTAQVTLSDGSGALFVTTVSHASSVAGNLNWAAFNQWFTARQSSTTLTFVSTNAGNGGVFLDSISVRAIVTPTLAISESGHQTVNLFWTTNAPAFHLIATPSLAPPIQWTAVTNQPIVNGASFTVNVSTVLGAQFFALRAP